MYEAAKIYRGALYLGKKGNLDTAALALKRAVDVAAREIEDANE